MWFDPQTRAVVLLVAGALVATLTVPVFVAGYPLYAPGTAAVGALLIVQGLRYFQTAQQRHHGGPATE